MSSWQQIIGAAVDFRRQLHQSPELTWQEEQTALRVREALTKLDIPWRPCAQYGTVATLAFDKAGQHIALRGDMDALPIEEKIDLDYRSQHKGCMHACGHDGHTAALWAAASWLKQHEADLPGPVSFLFQPAEEGGHGAKAMIEDGALEGIDVIYGWHNWPAMPVGKAICPDGPVMSGNGTFTIELTGQGGHASQPNLCRDPVLAAAAITLNLQQIISRRLAPQDAAVVNVSSIEAPSSVTVIPEKAMLTGSIRLGQSHLRQTINELIEQIAADTAKTYGVEADITIHGRYDATVNHISAAKVFRGVLQDKLGDAWCMDSMSTPIMASEDFSYYLKEIPGAFALVGMAKQGRFATPCHSPYYEFNDEILGSVVAVLCQLAGLSK